MPKPCKGVTGGVQAFRIASSCASPESSRLTSLRWLLSMRFFCLPEKGLTVLCIAINALTTPLQTGNFVVQKTSRLLPGARPSRRKRGQTLFREDLPDGGLPFLRNNRPFHRGKRYFLGYIPDSNEFSRFTCAVFFFGRFLTGRSRSLPEYATLPVKKILRGDPQY